MDITCKGIVCPFVPCVNDLLLCKEVPFVHWKMETSSSYII